MLKAFLLSILLLVSMPAFAGKNYFGEGSTKEEACKAAEAKAAPKSTATCYTPCRNCKEIGGRWQCQSNVPNWSSSCNSSDLRYSPPPATPKYEYQAMVCGGRIGVIKGSTDKHLMFHAVNSPVMVRWVFVRNGVVTSTMDVQVFPHQVETATAQPNGTVRFDCL